MVPVVLVEVVADSRGVGEELLDRHGVVDEVQVLAEEGAHRLVKPQPAVLDEAHDRERGEGLVATGDRDPGAAVIRTLCARWRYPLHRSSRR